MNYSVEDESKISAVMAQTRCVRQVAINYLADNGWNVHGAVCDICADECAEQMNNASGY